MDADKKMELPAIAGGEPVRKTKLFYGHQYIDEADVAAVTQVLTSDYLTCGPKVDELEARLCALTGAKYAVVCSNGTAALHIAAMAAGVTEGDEVITTPITFAASANCALYCGAKPVFADINPKTYNIDPAKVKEKITDKTRAVVAVDFTGQAVELDPLLEMCHEKGIILIEDGAHSIGTKYKGRPVGSIADLTTFSFHPVKTVTGGEGGAVLTNSKDLYEKLLLYRSHGITRKPELLVRESDGPWYYEQIDLGYNYRITDIQCALIISQLDKIEKFAARRRQIVERYNEAFSQIPEIAVQQEIPESDTTSASSFFTASSCFFLQCRAICLYGNPRCSIRCRLRVYGLAIWDSPIFTLPSSSCVRKSNSRPNVLMTISGFKVFSQYSSFFLYRCIRVK